MIEIYSWKPRIDPKRLTTSHTFRQPFTVILLCKTLVLHVMSMQMVRHFFHVYICTGYRIILKTFPYVNSDLRVFASGLFEHWSCSTNQNSPCFFSPVVCSNLWKIRACIYNALGEQMSISVIEWWDNVITTLIIKYVSLWNSLNA